MVRVQLFVRETGKVLDGVEGRFRGEKVVEGYLGGGDDTEAFG